MMNKSLTKYDVFLLDVDGVLVRDGQPIDRAQEAVTRLQGIGKVKLLTNNSTLSRQQTAAYLQKIGFNLSSDHIISSSYVAARYLLETCGKSKVTIVGEQGLSRELELAGHSLVDSPRQADWVVVGMDRQLSYKKLSTALTALLNGARLLATNRDATFPTPQGQRPGAGSAVGAVEGMGFSPETTVGKPSSIAYRIALEGIDNNAAVLVIGDRLETDILGANSSGLDSALVLTGVSTCEEIDRQGVHPLLVANDIFELASGRSTDPSTKMPPSGEPGTNRNF